MKTQNEILTDIYNLAKTHFSHKISGQIYKIIRPTDNNTEDVVISQISGVSSRFVKLSSLVVRVYYLDIANNNTFYENTRRGSELEELLFDFSNSLLKLPGYDFRVETREINIVAVPDIHQHLVALKINFKSLL